MLVLQGPAPNPDPGPFLAFKIVFSVPFKASGSFLEAPGSFSKASRRFCELVKASGKLSESFSAPFKASGSFPEKAGPRTHKGPDPEPRRGRTPNPEEAGPRTHTNVYLNLNIPVEPTGAKG